MQIISWYTRYKNLLKASVTRANEMKFRLNFSKTKGVKKTRQIESPQKTTSPTPHEMSGTESFISAVDHHNNDQSSRMSSTLLSGILYEHNSLPSDGMLDDMIENENDDNSSVSDDGSNYDIDETAFFGDEDGNRNDDDNVSKPPDGIDINYMSEDWKWNNWKDIDDDESIEGPSEHDRYNGPHGIKDSFPNRFSTVLHCVFKSTAMSRDFFQRLSAQSNKYVRKQMMERNSTLFLGHIWRNITTAEMIRFFGIMLRISLEPRKMGGYVSYFTDNPTVVCGDGYSIQLRGYDPWARDVMTLVRFKQIRSAFHPESENSRCNDKCHQLRYFIRLFNSKAKEVFDLGPNISFDEGGVAMRSRYCPVRMYNKDKPDKFRVDFFLLADSRYYFIYHLDVYQGKNKANIDIDSVVMHLPTTQKAVANAIVKSGIANCVDGCRYMFLDNRYACPQLLALMSTSFNVRGVGTCKANRKGFESNSLIVTNNSPRGTFARMVDDRLGMVITRWKDSRVLQVVSTIMKKGVGTVQRRVGREKTDVRCPNDIIEYQKHMGGVDRGDQHRVVGAGFANVAHFKKWYKKAFLGICDFSLLQAFTVWNIGANEVRTKTNERGSKIKKRRVLKKWEFYAIVAEEMMTYVEEDCMEQMALCNNRSIGDISHSPMPIPRNHDMKSPTCMICSMEEGILRRVLKSGNTKARHFSRRKKHLAICSDPNCNILCHSTQPDESKIRRIPEYAGLSCFEIAHHPDCADLFIEISRKGKMYTRSVSKHPMTSKIAKIYETQLPRRSGRKRGRPKIGDIVTPNQTHPIVEIQTNTQMTSTDVMSLVSNITPAPATPTRKKRKQSDRLGVVTRILRNTRSRSSKKTKK